MAFFFASRCSSWFLGILGAEVHDTQDISWRCCFAAWLYLPTMPSHVGVNVDGLVCPLHHPTDYSRQTRGQCLLPGVVLSHRYSGWWCLSRECEVPELGYLMEY
jgi:hypothetical protein